MKVLYHLSLLIFTIFYLRDSFLLKKKGTWSNSEPEPANFVGIRGDKGLVVNDAAKHHAISTKFEEPLESKGKPLVVQYEVKLQNNLECGGAYLKLLSAPFEPEQLDGDTPYTIMFGPDKCGTTNKVHFIFRHKNPLTGKFEEKHYKSPPTIGEGKSSHLYTLYVLENNTVEIYLDMERQSMGSLLEDFIPAVNPPKTIDDPEDKKPKDWVDEETIPDPTASKPDDWDEDAPKYIPDPDAVKPDEWDENEPEQIADPEAVKPSDWDDEEDGVWAPPMVDNPKCAASGCGKWKPEKIPNPDYKGKWVAPRIPNPAFKGKWSPKQIANPEFFEDLHPNHFHPIGGVGIEIWTMTSKITFDNIYIGSDLDDAFEFARNTWKVKHDVEKKLEEEHRQNSDRPPFYEPILKYMKENVVLVSVVSLSVTIIALLLCSFAFGGSQKETKKEKKEKKEEEAEEEEAEEAEEEEKAEEVKSSKSGELRKRRAPKDK